MKRRTFALGTAAVTATAAVFLIACSPQAPEPPAAPPVDRAQALAVLAAEGKGFTVGALMAANTAYVLFDPQCPHCAALWEASRPLWKQTRFVWLPVALLNAKSLPQGAAIMTAGDPVAAMDAHEQSLRSGGGGTAASAGIAPEIEAAIKGNTALLGRLGGESVPFLVGRHAGTGAPVIEAGAMPTAVLAQRLGLVAN